MSDHWKSLADRLGAPGLEPTTRRTRESSAQPSSPTAPIVPDTSSRTVPSGEVARQTSQRSDATSKSSAGLPNSSAGGLAEAPKKKKRSNWERVANLFGLGSEPDATEAVPSEVSENVSLDDSLEPTPDSLPQSRLESLITPVSQALTFDKPLSSSEASSDVSAIFESTSKGDTNPVLEEMFGQSKTPYPDVWDKPKRVVDDVGWDEPLDVWEKGLSPEEFLAESSLESPIERLESEDTADELDAPRRRSRRRRRRGRRGPDDGETGTGRSVDERKSGFDSSETLPSAEYKTDKAGKIDDQSSESEIAERRSSRRRRHRSGGRFDESVAEEIRSDIVDDRLLEDVDDVSEVLDSEPSRRDIIRDDEESRPGTRRRRRRPRGGRGEGSERVEAKPEDADIADPAFSVEEDDEDNDDPHSKGRHGHKSSRNIPTWDETLSVLITSNIENHRRNESRGSRGSGRSKGRR